MGVLAAEARRVRTHGMPAGATNPSCSEACSSRPSGLREVLASPLWPVWGLLRHNRYVFGDVLHLQLVPLEACS